MQKKLGLQSTSPAHDVVHVMPSMLQVKPLGHGAPMPTIVH
jgi:hypothetical protein